MTVAIVGMHRSGTSVATHLVSLLGLDLCRPDDLVRGHRGNEGGHWESASLVAHNDAVLAQVGAAWWCPPPSSTDVAELAAVEDLRAAARAAFEWAHPTDRWVWKDPRNCVLLPFWRSALDLKMPVVVILRDPHAIARSLHRRNRFSLAYGLALWERHLRSALAACDGLAVLVTSYDRLLDDPVGWCSETTDFLRMGGVDARMPRDPHAIEAVVGRSSGGELPRPVLAEPAPLSASQHELLSILDGTSGSWPAFVCPELPIETPSTETLFDEARTAFGLDPAQPRLVDQPVTFMSSVGIPLLDDGTAASRVPRAPRKRVSVVLAIDDPADVASTSGLRPFLPEDAEVIVVVGEDGNTAELDPGDDRCTVVRRGGPLRLGERLNLGAEVARGELLVFAHGLLAPHRGWLPALREALGANDVGAAGPCIVSPAAPDQRRYGLSPRGDLLDHPWITEPRSSAPFPVPGLSPLALATTRQVLDSTGGFDDALSGGSSLGLELCLRLWRSGYRCLAAPQAMVTSPVSRVGVDPLDTGVFDALRLALVHYTGPALAQVIGQLASRPEFPSALAQVSAGDVGRRRAIVAARAWYDTAWVLRRLEARGGPVRTRPARPRSEVVQP